MTQQLTRLAAQTLIAQFVEALNKGDIEKACTIYANGSHHLMNGEFIQGRENITRRFRSAFPANQPVVKMEMQMVTFLTPFGSDESRAMATATFKVRQTWQNGRERRGYALVVFQCIDDQISVVQSCSL